MSLRAFRARAWGASLGVAAAFALVVACGVHARRARAASRAVSPGIAAVARVLPSPDVAFTGGARWLRSPTVEEPAAAQQDGIAFPDPEPGSGAMTAPRKAWAGR